MVGVFHQAIQTEHKMLITSSVTITVVNGGRTAAWLSQSYKVLFQIMFHLASFQPDQRDTNSIGGLLYSIEIENKSTLAEMFNRFIQFMSYKTL